MPCAGADVAATDKRVKVCGPLKAYEEAGGMLRRDLLTEDDDGVIVLDVALLDRLTDQ